MALEISVGELGLQKGVLLSDTSTHRQIAEITTHTSKAGQLTGLGYRCNLKSRKWIYPHGAGLGL